MHLPDTVAAALAAGALFASTAALAAPISLTVAPSNLPYAATVGAADFNAVGLQSNLFSTLVINGSSGVQSFSQTGSLDVTSFVDASNAAVASGLNSAYKIKATFSLSGSGSWSGATFTAAPGLSFGLNLFATDLANGNVLALGSGTLDATAPSLFFALAAGSLAPGATGNAFTSLTASLVFTPAAGTTGSTGFFKVAPSTFDLGFQAAGGNFANTGYSVSPSNVVTIGIPLAGTNPGTANVSFESAPAAVPVPEPATLPLALLSLAGVAATARRRAQAAA